MANITGTSGNDILNGTNFDDFIQGLEGADELRGNDGNDTLWGGVGADYLFGGNGDDYLEGDNGADWLQGDSGNDVLYGGNGDDKLLGNAGNDYLVGSANDADVMTGGVGNDDYHWFNGNTVNENANEGIDSVWVDASYTLPANVENLFLNFDVTSVVTLTGNNLGNYMMAVYADDSVVALGNDGNDHILTGEGSDNLNGGAGNDTLTAYSGNDALVGGSGNDDLDGGVGNDVLNGGGGMDELTGGTGSDIFRFATALGTNNADEIFGFTHNSDEFELSAAIFQSLGALGTEPFTLPAANFRANAGGVAVDSNDFILYDTTTSTLYYDSDGNGAAAKVIFATVYGLPTITNIDFTVIS